MLLNKRVPLLYILNTVKIELLYTLLVSLFVVFITKQYDHLLPDMPLTIPAFIGTAISILLSFKLNQSYDRWWEARKIWGSIVNDSRTLILQLRTLSNGDTKESVRRIALRHIAWSYALSYCLRGQEPAEKLSEFISDEELSQIKDDPNKPLSLLQMNGEEIQKLKLDNRLTEYTHVQIDNTLVRLCESQGKAERIKKTVFPVTYTLFVHFMVYLFVITLSVSLSNVEGCFEVPLLLIISSAFFLLEKSATHMQDPFENKPTDTPMTSIAHTIESNIKQIISEPAPPAYAKEAKYYIN